MEIKTCEEYVVNELNNKINEVATLKETLARYEQANATQANNIDLLVGFISRHIKADEKGLTMDPVVVSEKMSAQDSSDVNLIYNLYAELSEIAAKKNQNTEETK